MLENWFMVILAINCKLKNNPSKLLILIDVMEHSFMYIMNKSRANIKQQKKDVLTHFSGEFKGHVTLPF